MLNNGLQSPACEILYVDDEEKALKYFRMAFAAQYTIHTASSAKEGLEILRRPDSRIGIVISDQRMPETQGAEFLGQVREEFPHAIRILTTAYSDLESAIQAVNRGHIYQYVVKPWEPRDLGMVLQRASDYHHVLSERNQLLALKMNTLQRILCGDRLLWLLLHPAGADLAPAWRSALRAYLQALPAPDFPPADFAGAAPFEAATILRGEYGNAAKTLARFGESVAWQKPAQVRDEELGKFASLLGASYQPPGPGAGAGLSLSGGKATLREIFGLLLAREVGEASLALFKALVAIALLKGSLTLSLSGEAEGKYEFAFADAATPTPEELIDILYRRISVWDVGLR